MSDDGRLIRTLVACYPARWRRRYGEEYAQLLCDLRVHRSARLILDSLLGAVRAHGGVLMSQGSPLAATVWAVGLFTVAGLGFAKLAEDVTGPASGSYLSLVAAAAVTLVAAVVGTAPTAVALLRADPRRWRYVTVPVVGLAVWSGVLRLALAISAGQRLRSLPNLAAFALVTATGLAVVAATAWAATRILRPAAATWAATRTLRPAAVAPATRLRSVALIVVTAGMAWATAAAVAWGLRVRAVDPAVFRGDDGILATPFVLSWLAVVAALAVATTVTATHHRRRPPTSG